MAALVCCGGQTEHLQNIFAVNVSHRQYPESKNLWEGKTVPKDCLKQFGHNNTGVGKEQVLIIFAFKN